MKPIRVSLAAELAELAHVLESAQLIAELLATHAMPDEATSARAPMMLEAVLALVVGRMQLLRKVVIGAADVQLLLSAHNGGHARTARDDPDVLLSSRPTGRAAKHPKQGRFSGTGRKAAAAGKKGTS